MVYKKNNLLRDQTKGNETEPNYTRPVVGILMKENHIKRLLLKQRPLLKHQNLIRANSKANITLYFCSTQDFYVKKSFVKGIYYNEHSRKWERKDFPYPDVIYKSYGTKTKKSLGVGFEDQLKKLNIEPLNYLYCFNKWEVYENLMKQENLMPHLPMSILFENPDSLKGMLEKNSKVYLKACKSGRGRGVICVERLPGGGFVYSYYINQLYVKTVKDFNTLIHGILGFYQNKSFIIQKAINLLKIEDKIVDIRSELQKNADGDRVVAALAVRVSNSNAPITTHASSYSFEYFFKYFLHYSEAEILRLKARINDFLIMIYQTIERKFGQSGELSVDIGIDQEGHLWFIECNAYSGKVSFSKAYDQKIIDQAYENLLAYSIFLYKSKAK